MLWINETKLNLLLEEKRQFIGKTVVFDILLSSCSFLISVALASYEDYFGIPGIIFKFVFVIMGIVFTGKSIYDIHNNCKNNYTHEDLFNDINKLNEITHKHSIIAIKNTFEEYPNKFLLYEDKRWGCKFFLNYKENINNEDYIKRHLSNELKVCFEDISLVFIAENVHRKFSESHHEDRVYSHRLYAATIRDIPDYMRYDSFVIEGREYYWKNISEMEQDERISKVNSDIVGFVKDNCT